MKFRWIAAFLIFALGLVAGGSTYLCFRKPLPVASAGEDASLLWLRSDFNLPADKMARIAQLHEAYRGICDEHCRQIREARVTVKKMRAASAEHCDIVAAEAKVADLDRVCVTSLEAHLREIAGVIGGNEGERYLAVVLPRIAHFDHSGAPNLNLDTTDKTHDHHAHH
ncbi:MAG: hypothetical protein QM715_09350 [Nibricoccus sp.]